MPENGTARRVVTAPIRAALPERVARRLGAWYAGRTEARARSGWMTGAWIGGESAGPCAERVNSALPGEVTERSGTTRAGVLCCPAESPTV